MNTNKRIIFFDQGVRWKKLKILALVSVIGCLFFIGIVAYSFVYSPFENTLDANATALLEAQTAEISALSKPALQRGTFLKIEDVYGEPYVKRSGENKKMVVLTFDDGPNPQYTPRIISILKDKGVKGTFFVVGSQIYKYPEIGKAILETGSEMGLHTFSHNPSGEPLDNLTMLAEMDFSQKIFAYLYGFKTNLFRIPFVGTDEDMSEHALTYLEQAQKRGMVVSAPTVDSRDWATSNPAVITAYSTLSNVQTVVLLLHDSGGNRENTVKALPGIIDYYRAKGYEFKTVSELALGQNLPVKSDLTTKDTLLVPLAYHSYNIYKKAYTFFDKGFLLGFALVIFHIGFFLLLAILQVWTRMGDKRSSNFLKKKGSPSDEKLITILVPFYNEEQVIADCVRSLLNSNYTNIELLAIDDGSTDASSKKLEKFQDDPRLRVIKKENGGKFSALNYGISLSQGEIFITADADTIVEKNAISEIVRCFNNPQIGAVAADIRVGNANRFLTILQSLEYTLNQGIEKRALDLWGSVLVVPGALGGWRRSAVLQSGGFSQQTQAEDFDLTLSMIGQGLKVVYCDRAMGFTEAPQSISQLMVQRLRWNFGNLQVYFKHRKQLFSLKSKMAGMFFLPRAIFIQIPLTLVMPLVDVFILINLLIGERELTIVFLLLYFWVYFLMASVAHLIQNQPLRYIAYTPFLRFFYAQLMYYVFYKAVLKALRGNFVSWSKLHHIGSLPQSNQSSTFANVLLSNEQHLPPAMAVGQNTKPEFLGRAI